MTFADQPVEGFLDDVASTNVAPSAGAVTAITGAMAGSLCEMVCIHTPDAETSPRLATARADLAERRDQLLDLADADAAVIDAVGTAFEDETDAEDRQAALARATEVPLRIAEAAADVAERAVVVAEDGTTNARTDAVVGAHLARAATAAAAVIVRTNLDLWPDLEAADSRLDDARTRLEAAERDAAAAVSRLTESRNE
ncbi:MAG: cyclodeaminase/cyclohydrolase family protein [Haloglomus sp.]